MGWIHLLTQGALTCVLTGTLLLAGCSEDPEPRFAAEPSRSPAASTSESASPSAAPDVQPPKLPDRARSFSPAAAEAFVRHWVQLLNWSQATGKTSRLEKLSEPGCTACRGIVQGIVSTYEAGGRIEGGDWQIRQLEELPLDHGADWAAYAEASAEPQVVTDGDGARTAYDGGPFQFYAYPAWEDDEWRMRWLRTPYAG